VLTAAEMRALEAEAIQGGRVSGRTLMARAGAGCLAALEAARPDLRDRPGRAVVLCGPGNNGGDGYVIADGLAARGWTVAVCALGDPARLPPDARHFHDLWAATHPVYGIDTAAARMEGADLIVDALFGIGLTRPVDGPAAEVLRAVPKGPMRLSVDVPSGRDTETGVALGGLAFPADLVVTFHAEKPVHAVLRAESIAVSVQDIGL
jgi:hydroxyethylthiazole kinase-like uncharacterized protein yjeF